jgi:hypothetical protein
MNNNKFIKEGNNNINLTKKVGFWAAVFSVIFYIMFDAAAVVTLTGLLSSKFWISILYYVPSIFLALSFVILMISINNYAPDELKIWSNIAVALSIIYATLNCFVYIIQVLIIAPSFLNGQFGNVALFEMAPGNPLYAVNALAYTLMGLSTLFSSFVFKGEGIKKIVRRLLLTHGIISPAIIGVLIWEPLFYISAWVGILYPTSAIFIARLFRQK